MIGPLAPCDNNWQLTYIVAYAIFRLATTEAPWQGRRRGRLSYGKLAELVADTLSDFDAAKYAADPEHYYRPTILSGAVAAAYDAAMARARCPIRCWRGSKSEARS